MLTRDIPEFLKVARSLPADLGPAVARGAFLVSPDGMWLNDESAGDNAYMDLARRIDPDRALAQHRGLHAALSRLLPTVAFAGDPATPDAVFPNNVFATAHVGGQGRYLVARMCHPIRQREADRADISGFFERVLGYARFDLREKAGVGELTGSMVIDRARGIGFCGLSRRCDEAGAAAMHAAFGLRATLMFDLAPSEYHTNVVLTLMAGRAALLAPDGFADPAVVEAVASLYRHAVRLSPEEKAAYAGNAITLSGDTVWMSGTAGAALSEATRQGLAAAGFALATVDLDELEKAGGSLRCCVGEIF